MTNELKQAIETVKEYLDMDSDVDSEYLNAQRTIINALETPPTDAVSREAVIRLVEQYPNIIGNRCSGLIADIKHLPSVTPRTNPAETSQDCISREAVLVGLANIAKAKAKSDAQKSMMGRCMFFVEQLSPVTPQPKIGRWILTDVEGNRVWYCNCSECGKDPQDYISGSENWWLIKNKLPRYCPNCGAEMGVEE